MSNDVDITEVSDPRDLTIDDVPTDTSAPAIRILAGQPSDEEIAALVLVLSGSGGGGGAADSGPQELNRWGLPIDKLRYSVHSWQNVTLVERTHMRR